MFVLLCLVCLLAAGSVGAQVDQEWDLAAAISDRVEFLSSNGTLLAEAQPQFSALKALAYDGARREFIVSDMNQKNDTIYTFQLSKETDSVPIEEDLPDDVQGLAVDPVDDILYWTDSLNGSINFKSLYNRTEKTETLLQFDDEQPQAIALDSCKRLLYWTNSNMKHPTIDRASLDGSQHETFISEDLFMPTGITLDRQKLYWADVRQGIYFRIESISFDGTDRKILHESTHHKPYALAIHNHNLYWTDINNNALWMMPKTGGTPKMIRQFDDQPMGLVSYTPSSIDCDAKEIDRTTTEHLEVLKRNSTCDDCGKDLCYNYCNNGNCYISSYGMPQCRCPAGFIGRRCERNVCDNFCLNGGSCRHDSSAKWGAVCSCQDGFRGSRCEVLRVQSATEICKHFCQITPDDVFIAETRGFKCSCEQGSFRVYEHSNLTQAAALLTQSGPMGYFQDPIFFAICACMLTMFAVIVYLSFTVFRMKRRRPRIKKRIVVNKNVTPLTYRPQPSTEQCEITIENCCNMNVCDTPCFEPASLQGFQSGKKDEKKTLLSNMENADDLY